MLSRLSDPNLSMADLPQPDQLAADERRGSASDDDLLQDLDDLMSSLMDGTSNHQVGSGLDIAPDPAMHAAGQQDYPQTAVSGSCTD